jgi:hypothetical protein
MTNIVRLATRSISSVTLCAVALAVSACGAQNGADEANVVGSTTEALGLAGPWQFSSEDFDPPTFNAASVYTIHGNSIDFAYQGKGPFSVTGPAISGIHFKQPVDVVQGGTYRLQLDVTNLVGASPTLFWASVSGATPPSSLVPIVGNASATIDFAVTAAPGASPTIELLNKPITVRPGIGLQNFTVTATLTKTN